jgi:hypothetical protein
MITKQLIIYVTLITALAIQIFSTCWIGVAVFSVSTGRNDVPGINGVISEDDDDNIISNEDEPPILPINQRKLAVKNGEKGPKGVSDVLPRLFELPRRTIDPTKLPYKCGVILIQHHISGIDGAAIDNWIRGLVDFNDDSGAAYISSADAGSKEAFVAEINEQMDMKGEFYWTVLGSGKHGLALASDGDVLRRLRENMEERGCHLLAMSMFSDPLDYSMKQTRQMFAKCKNCNVNEFTMKLESGKSDVYWRGQLDYFLYNTGEIVSDDTKVKVKEAITKLREHYDLVLLDGKDDVSKEIIKVTGWKSPHDEEEAVTDADMEVGGLRYTKQMVKQYSKFDAKNGDADFYDALNHIYYNHLAFLFNQ